jgi:hypothetical protein
MRKLSNSTRQLDRLGRAEFEALQRRASLPAARRCRRADRGLVGQATVFTRPLSTYTTLPVVNVDASDARNSAAPTISSAAATRWIAAGDPVDLLAMMSPEKSNRASRVDVVFSGVDPVAG